MPSKKSSQTVGDKILRRIRASRSASVFSNEHFNDFGSREAIDQALSRLAKQKRIRRIARGLYDLPRQHRLMGELSPDMEAVAKTIADRSGGRLQPTEALAANLLGLSEQVPAKIVYQSDLPYKAITIGNQTIEFRKRSPRQMALSDRPSALLVSALRSLGKQRIPLDRLDELHKHMSEKDRKQLLEDIPHVPTWMRPHLRHVATGSSLA